VAVLVTAGSVQDRDGSQMATKTMEKTHPGLRLIWADGGYTGRFVACAQTKFSIVIEIVRKDPDQTTFEVLPRRWIVERTFGWIIKCRRLAADYERRTEHAEAMFTWAMIGVMSRRLAGNTRGHDVTTWNWK
jgi:transposase